LEPCDLFKNKAEVFVADGFVGNVLIKIIETFQQMMRKSGGKSPLFDRLNYEIYGGSPILGVNAPVILGHGISSPRAIKNMLVQSKRMCEEGVVDMLRQVTF
ncbi:MAG: phosphate--acyl-ACP acyltransferase, partial [Bacteroidales bacterium]|nr:phosphate--acyl-ACP acyltransferase [Bacteroidales bacterium]